MDNNKTKKNMILLLFIYIKLNNFIYNFRGIFPQFSEPDEYRLEGSSQSLYYESGNLMQHSLSNMSKPLLHQPLPTFRQYANEENFKSVEMTKNCYHAQTFISNTNTPTEKFDLEVNINDTVPKKNTERNYSQSNNKKVIHYNNI